MRYLKDNILNEALVQYFEEGKISKITMGFRIHPHQDLVETLKKHEYPGYLNFVNKCKDIDDLKYLRQDTHQGINTIKRIREIIADDGTKYKNRDNSKYVKAGITTKDCDLTIKFYTDKVLPAITARIKELKEK